MRLRDRSRYTNMRVGYKRRCVGRKKRGNGVLRTWLYSSLAIKHHRYRIGLKDYLKVDTTRLRLGIRETAPDCPKYRWV